MSLGNPNCSLKSLQSSIKHRLSDSSLRSICYFHCQKVIGVRIFWLHMRWSWVWVFTELQSHQMTNEKNNTKVKNLSDHGTQTQKKFKKVWDKTCPSEPQQVEEQKHKEESGAISAFATYYERKKER
ncbi:hypothetical protein K1719_044164 [Acacia pycnantha]|nr:hypothetical protein K1719_044164 [Acacia pycnantha]